MKPEIKNKWLDALRSGEYKQTKDVLRKGDSFCCLGVLCDVYTKENQLESEWILIDAQGGYKIYDDKGIIPYPIQRWAGLTEGNPSAGNEYDLTLSKLNDSGKTFLEIADIIEKEL